MGSARTGSTPVSYPFPSFDGSVMIGRQTSGQRTFDINSDGVAHYGLYPDWIEDVRILGGQAVIDDMAKGAEAYLQMWERATGIGTSGGPGAPGSPKGGSPKASKQQCAKLRAKLKRAKSKKAKRKLRSKLRKRGC